MELSRKLKIDIMDNDRTHVFVVVGVLTLRLTHHRHRWSSPSSQARLRSCWCKIKARDELQMDGERAQHYFIPSIKSAAEAQLSRLSSAAKRDVARLVFFFTQAVLMSRQLLTCIVW